MLDLGSSRLDSRLLGLGSASAAADGSEALADAAHSWARASKYLRVPPEEYLQD